jgi:hypothetical protein
MEPINPCKILDDIYHLAVLAKVVPNSCNSAFDLRNGTSALAIERAKDINACCP